MANETATIDALHTKLVDDLVANSWVSTNRVAAALRTVPRHHFVPDEPAEVAYANDAVITKRDSRGAALSSVSAPSIVALMLEQADIRPGQSVLEIGSGGYNAALVAELVGESGQVTTIDVDPDVTERARRCLRAAGYDAVRVLCADGEYGAEEHAPYDRIIVTAGAWDIPLAWRRQLRDGGRLVVPLRMLGLARSVVFQRVQATDRLVSQGYELCGFVPMQGIGERAEQAVPLHGDDVVLVLEPDEVVDSDALRAALGQPRAEAWTGVTVGRQQGLDGMELWLACTLPGFCRMPVQRSAIDSGLVAPSYPWGTRAVIDGDSFAYLAIRKVPDPDAEGGVRFELGAYAHGSAAQELAERVAERIRAWIGEHPTARIEVYPAGTPDAELPQGRVIDKRYTRITVSWP